MGRSPCCTEVANLKRGPWTPEEDQKLIDYINKHGHGSGLELLLIFQDEQNEIKNFWNTHIRKKLLNMGIDPHTHKPRTDLDHRLNLSQFFCAAQLGNLMNPWDTAFKL
ncbi:hypothetical protein CRYUN_Cryun19dG0159000 [Craigia yunnanensis]